jgi:uncharacterized membrane protein
MTAVLLLTVASSVCAGLIGGVFFAFSVFVMRALAELPPEQGVAAMQRINVTVITPLFLGVFLGTVPLLAAATYAAYSNSTSVAVTAWLFAAFAVYTVGSVGVTMALNVPRNNRLASMAATSSEAVSYWPVYVKEWLLWNHVRTVASLLAAAGCVIAGGQ